VDKKNKCLNEPAYLTTSMINIKGVLANRLMVVYQTIGCMYGKCTMCDFAHYKNSQIIEENIKKQHQKALYILNDKSQKVEHFDLLTLGNFFNNDEVSESLREFLLKSLANIPTLKRVLTESRREYLTLEKLDHAKRCLRDDQILEFALGYESSNDSVRNEILNKDLPEHHLDEVLNICKELNVDFVSYVLIKPHLLTELEGIKDATETAIHVLEKAKNYGVSARIAFEPVFVTQKGILNYLWKNKKYTPPKIWSIIEVIIRTATKLNELNVKGKLFVGLSDENLSIGRMTTNCGICDEEIKKEIQRFNGHQEVYSLMNLNHECKKNWEEMLKN
jgi:archaeosine synthase beta-subunit